MLRLKITKLPITAQYNCAIGHYKYEFNEKLNFILLKIKILFNIQ